MTKTQIQVPDELYKKAKEIAKAKEWSLAEVFRRGLEYMARTHKPDSDEEWKVPTLDCGEMLPQSIEDLNSLIDDDRDSDLIHRAGLGE